MQSGGGGGSTEGVRESGVTKKDRRQEVLGDAQPGTNAGKCRESSAFQLSEAPNKRVGTRHLAHLSFFLLDVFRPFSDPDLISGHRSPTDSRP